ncbi:sulfotransferase [Cognatiyoonia sp. IB215446]|uniref:sulfotransferase n=1 Tax=Cognatiyoonia sp. IB215446 TaxID=3097355 RepID=UPI002A15E4D6|nr:sulfotransferase [Cognatiyoonia sp. IB215446]MDX8349534.1 sulfotransferase [Cognatiyoonia sp. IB215446]
MTQADLIDGIDARFRTADRLLFIIGSQKCGTSWLHRYFEGHPQVCLPAWKEQNYWNAIDGYPVDDFLKLRRRQLQGPNPVLRLARRVGLKPYKRPAKLAAVTRALAAQRNAGPPHSGYADSIFEFRTPESRVFGEACPQYALLHSDTYRQMDRLGPEVRFVFVMRDPVARMISGVKHSMRMAAKQSTFRREDVVDAVLASTRGPGSWGYRMTRYDEMIARLEAAVSPERIGYYFFEDLFDQTQIDQLCDFVGVSRHTADFEEKVNFDGRPQLTLTAEERVEVVATFRNVYESVIDRFGDQVPDAWHRSLELLPEMAAS